MSVSFAQHASHFDAIRRAALAAADPGSALENAWPTHGFAPTVLIALGKASVPMAIRAARLLGDRLTCGVVVAPPELAADPEPGRLGLEVCAADHPWPTARNITAAQRIRECVRTCPRGHDLLVLISGGGSAHLTLPAPPLTLDDLVQMSMRLQRAGATIGELNAVRKHTELLKGGRLLEGCQARRVVALILSDVVGDRLDTIASGPCSPDATTYADALRVLDRHGLDGELPRVVEHLRRGARGEISETPKPGDPALAGVESRIIASNALVLERVVEQVRKLGFGIARVQAGVEGEAAKIGRSLGHALEAFAQDERACAILLGGEPTVTVGTSAGAGGPSQELALAAACVLSSDSHVAVMALSTDGRDGPTDAAGAIVTSRTLEIANQIGVDLERALASHDSHAALDRLGALIRTGPTGTNVNHVIVGLAYAK